MADRAEDLRRSKLALDGVFNGPDGKQGTADDFDAILHLGNSGAGTPAKAGYPSVAVPGGFNALSTLTPRSADRSAVPVGHDVLRAARSPSRS